MKPELDRCQRLLVTDVGFITVPPLPIVISVLDIEANVPELAPSDNVKLRSLINCDAAVGFASRFPSVIVTLPEPKRNVA